MDIVWKLIIFDLVIATKKLRKGHLNQNLMIDMKYFRSQLYLQHAQN